MLDLRAAAGETPHDFPSEAGAPAKDIALETVDVTTPGLTADAHASHIASSGEPDGDTPKAVADGSSNLFGQAGPRSRFLWWSRSGVRGNVG